MTIEEYKNAFLKLFEDMQNEHGVAKSVTIGRKENPWYDGDYSSRLSATKYISDITIEF